MLTKDQMLIAAEMLDKREAKMDKDSSEDHIAAMDWLFENGVFYAGPEGCDEIAKMLREKAATISP